MALVAKAIETPWLTLFCWVSASALRYQMSSGRSYIRPTASPDGPWHGIWQAFGTCVQPSMLRGMVVPMLPAAVDSRARWRVLTRNTDTLDTDGHWKTKIAIILTIIIVIIIITTTMIIIITTIINITHTHIHTHNHTHTPTFSKEKDAHMGFPESSNCLRWC